ncbi:MAG TPA: nucleotidyl transferase AbiEii/AbiGii toxin family protein [Ignavibacteriaceae bacterium]|nr:nucleotidyl transferase AbiEii/AbiGii toxin family protein [Ignavibacteriaceae bacterium]
MQNKNLNLGVVKIVADALGELNDQVVYVGGAVVGIYADDPAAEDVRPTKDVDITLKIASYVELTKLEEELLRKEFKRDPLEKVECRFFLNEILVDVMSTTRVGWAPANRWFEPAFSHIKEFNLEGTIIKIFTLAYFLATKFEAFNDRGKKDPRTSHDLEDIIYVLNNNLDLVKDILTAPEDVKKYLKDQFQVLLNSPVLQEAMLANLSYETQSERQKIINSKLKEIVDAV